jgi:hypothetical protein
VLSPEIIVRSSLAASLTVLALLVLEVPTRGGQREPVPARRTELMCKRQQRDRLDSRPERLPQSVVCMPATADAVEPLEEVEHRGTDQFLSALHRTFSFVRLFVIVASAGPAGIGETAETLRGSRIAPHVGQVRPRRASA